MAIASGQWAPVGEIGPSQAIDAVSTTQVCPIGKVLRCRDMGPTNYGEAEFIYLRGTASTALGNYVVYEGNGDTIRAVARSAGPGAVAMAATGANQFGWYQRTGRAKVTAGTVADNLQLYLSGTAGGVATTVVAGDLIYGARSDGATDTGFALATLSYPSTGDTDNA